MTGEWHVDRLRLENFRHYRDLAIDFGPEATLLVGENGAGKTAILDALAVLLSTVISRLGGDSKSLNVSDARILPDELDSIARAATLEQVFPVVVGAQAWLAGSQFVWDRQIRDSHGRTTWGSQEVRDFSASLIERATTGNLEERDSTVLPVLAYYGVERLTREIRAQGSIPASRKGAYFSALDPRSDVRRLFAFLESLDEQIVRAAAFGDPEPRAAKLQFDAIDRACTSILEPVGWGRLRWNANINGPTLHHTEHGTLPLTYLATGTRIAAGLAIDLASRMARANPAFGERNLLESTSGIVMIDEVDLHLHPSWQQQMVPLLRRTFPKVQFILTTHSPQVIGTVEAKNIRVLHECNVSTPDYAEGLRPEVILQQLQGVDPVPNTSSRELLDQYLELVDSGEGRSGAAMAMREELNRTLGGAQFNRELLNADAALAFADWAN